MCSDSNGGEKLADGDILVLTVSSDEITLRAESNSTINETRPNEYHGEELYVGVSFNSSVGSMMIVNGSAHTHEEWYS